jgi:hypothetical protein
METDGLKDGHQRVNGEWQRNQSVVGRVERGEASGQRLRAQETLERARKNIGSHVRERG